MRDAEVSSGFIAGFADFGLIAATGYGAWWLFDAAVPADWCAGGRWDAVFLMALLPLFLARFAAPPRGRVRWAQITLLAACAVMATPIAVLAGRLLGGCTDVEGEVGGMVVLPHLVVGSAIGLATAAAWLVLAARLPTADGQPVETLPNGTGPALRFVATIMGGLLLVLAWPHLVDAAATALLDRYCPAQRPGNPIHAILLIVFGQALRDRGWAAWKPALLTGLGALAVISVADVAAGLAVDCPIDGNDPEGRQGALRLFIRAGGVGVAAALIFQRLSRRATSRDDDTAGEAKP